MFTLSFAFMFFRLQCSHILATSSSDTSLPRNLAIVLIPFGKSCNKHNKKNSLYLVDFPGCLGWYIVCLLFYFFCLIVFFSLCLPVYWSVCLSVHISVISCRNLIYLDTNIHHHRTVCGVARSQFKVKYDRACPVHSPFIYCRNLINLDANVHHHETVCSDQDMLARSKGKVTVPNQMR